jgi:mannosyltransferase OCH1-like enzyme
MIPAIIHQTWKTTDLPPDLRANQETWRKQNPDWTYMFWTDADLEPFVAKNYPQLLSLFRRYPHHIQRVDAVRYMILHTYGGIYADLDIICRRPLDPFRQYEAFVAPTAPIGVSNDFMGCSEKSPFAAYLVSQLPSAYRSWPRFLVPHYFRVLLTTGSMFVTFGLRNWKGRDSVTVIPGGYYGDGSDPEPYVGHTPGQSWHSWDAKIFLYIFAHPWQAALGAAAVAAVLVAGAFLAFGS